LSADHRIVCWGSDVQGESSPPGGDFEEIATGEFFACGRLMDGTIQCWGHSFSGETSPPDGSFAQISAGASHACAIRDDGSALCWGVPIYDDSTPAPIPDGIAWKQISPGGGHVCGITSEGDVRCWGNDYFGQANPPSGKFVQVSAGTVSTCAIREDGTIACWGDVSAIRNVPEGSFTKVATGNYHSCALDKSGKAKCWGFDAFGETNPPDDVFTAISAGQNVSCGIRQDKTAVCWGGNLDLPQCARRPLCGNLEIDDGEDCDDGDIDFHSGEACDWKCARVACGQPTEPDADRPTVIDALFTLRAAVGLERCADSVCDVDSSGRTAANDALAVLRKSSGLPGTLTCPQA
jgi:alpha-tubulin suppressor-like RCC1 family protein